MSSVAYSVLGALLVVIIYFIAMAIVRKIEPVKRVWAIPIYDNGHSYIEFSRTKPNMKQLAKESKIYRNGQVPVFIEHYKDGLVIDHRKMPLKK